MRRGPVGGSARGSAEPSPTSIVSGSTHTEVAQLDAGHVHGSSVCEMPRASSARNVSAIAFTRPGGSTTRSVVRGHGGLVEGREVERGEFDRRAGLRPRGDDLALGDRVGRARVRGVEQRLEVDAVEVLPPCDRGAAEGPLSHLGFGQEDRARQQRERARDQSGCGCQQAAAGVECGLEDLLLERFVADDLGDQQVAGSGSSRFRDQPGSSVTRSDTPLTANTRSATSAMSLASTAYTCRAPARAAATARTPLPVPMSSTTSSGRTVAARAAR